MCYFSQKVFKKAGKEKEEKTPHALKLQYPGCSAKQVTVNLLCNGVSNESNRIGLSICFCQQTFSLT